MSHPFERVPPEVLSHVAQYNGIDELWSLCYTSKAFFPILELTPGILIRLAAREGGYRSRVVSKLLPLLRRGCIQTPSARRILRLLKSNFCEMCIQKPRPERTRVFQPRGEFGLMTCWPCQRHKSVSVHYLKDSRQYKLHPVVVNELLDAPQVGASREYGWRFVLPGLDGHERARADRLGYQLRLKSTLAGDDSLDVIPRLQINDMISYLQTRSLFDHCTGEPIGCIVTRDKISGLVSAAVRLMGSEGGSATDSVELALQGLVSANSRGRECVGPSPTRGIPLRADPSLLLETEAACVSEGLAERDAMARAVTEDRRSARLARVDRAATLVRRIARVAKSRGPHGRRLAEQIMDFVPNEDFVELNTKLNGVSPLVFSYYGMGHRVTKYVCRPSAFQSGPKVKRIVDELIASRHDLP